MSETVELAAADGHILDAYIAHPDAEPIAGLVVIQEIFGVNQHIRSVADGYARDGFLAVAPALFHRVERNVELPCDGPEAKKGVEIMQQLRIEILSRMLTPLFNTLVSKQVSDPASSVIASEVFWLG